MSTPTPRRSLARPRPSLGNSNLNTASSPNLGASFASSQRPSLSSQQISGLGAFGRKAPLHQLTSGTLSTIPDGSVGYGLTPTKEEEASSPFTVHPTTPTTRRMVTSDGAGDGEVEVGDAVDVPGGMYGTVKFIGAVKNKKGIFAGVELSREWAPRGKNDGDVDGLVAPIDAHKISC